MLESSDARGLSSKLKSLETSMARWLMNRVVIAAIAVAIMVALSLDVVISRGALDAESVLAPVVSNLKDNCPDAIEDRCTSTWWLRKYQRQLGQINMLNNDPHRQLGFVMVGDSVLEGLSWPAKHSLFFPRSNQNQVSKAWTNSFPTNNKFCLSEWKSEKAMGQNEATTTISSVRCFTKSFTGKLFNFGLGGDQTRHLLWRLQNSNILQVDTALFWIMIGINDLNYHMDPLETSQRIYEIARYILASQTHAKISILGILPACYRGNYPEQADLQECISNGGMQSIKVVNGELYNIISKLNSEFWCREVDVESCSMIGRRATYLDCSSYYLHANGTMDVSLYHMDLLHPREPVGYKPLVHCISEHVFRVR